MRLTTFPLFSELTPELRNRIWEFAIISHIRDLADRLPPRFHYLWAVRQSFATLGDVPGKNGAALYFNLRDPYNGQKLCFEKDEFENLVHCFLISAVCHETRINVAKVCRVLVPNMIFNYDTTTSSSLTPPEKGAKPIILRSLRWSPSAESLEHVFSQPIRLTVNPGEFKSAEHLVGMVFRFFGNKIQHLSMYLEGGDNNPVNHAYWPDPGASPSSIKAILNHNSKAGLPITHLIKDQELEIPESFWQNVRKSRATFDHCYKEDSTTVRVARNRELHVSEIFWQTRTKDVTIPTMHLLNMYQLLDASMDILPYLEHIEVYHVVRGRGSQRTTFTTNWKRNDRVRW